MAWFWFLSLFAFGLNGLLFLGMCNKIAEFNRRAQLIENAVRAIRLRKRI